MLPCTLLHLSHPRLPTPLTATPPAHPLSPVQGLIPNSLALVRAIRLQVQNDTANLAPWPCSGCGMPSVELRRCSGCSGCAGAQFCSKECSVASWPAHKAVSTAAAARHQAAAVS